MDGTARERLIVDAIPVMRPALGDEEARAAAEAVASGWVAQGPRVATFETELAGRVGAEHGVALSSCTAALHLALILAGVKPGREVIVPSLSFIATANVVRYVGAIPVFADVEAVRSLCDPLQITVIEDAACAVGSSHRGMPIGGHSDLVAFSFHPRKIITTGEGGMLMVRDADQAARARRLREHGMNVSAAERHASRDVVLEAYLETGFNYRMTDVQAAIGLVQLRRLDEIIQRRRLLAGRYQEMLAHVPGLVTITDPPEGLTNFQSFWVQLDGGGVGRDEVLRRMTDRGVLARRGIMASHLEPAYAGGPVADLPVTEAATRGSLILPLFHDMTDAQQERVVETFLEAIEFSE